MSFNSRPMRNALFALAAGGVLLGTNGCLVGTQVFSTLQLVFDIVSVWL